MNVIEHSKYRDEEGNISIMERLNATLDFGLRWHGHMQAQEVVTNRLARVFGEEHVLLRNVAIPGVDESNPHMILVGPQGVRIIMAFPVRGVFRAKDDDWLRFDSRSRRFKRARPNLQTLSLNLLQRVRHLLEIQGYENLVVEAILIFTHPRTLIDSARPLTRVVSADAIEYFAANLNRLQPILPQGDIRNIVEAIRHPKIPDPEQTSSLLNEPVQTPPVALSELPAVEPVQDFSIPADFVPDPMDQRAPLAMDRPDPLSVDPIAPEPIEQSQSEVEMPFYPDSYEDFDRESFLQYADDEVLSQEDPMDEEQISYEPLPNKRGLLGNPKLSGTQWIFLAALASIEIVILVIFAYIYFQ